MGRKSEGGEGERKNGGNSKVGKGGDQVEMNSCSQANGKVKG